jgi:hypothetical protein
MERHRLNSSKLRSAGYDEKSQTLEIEFSNGQVWQYGQVSPELWRRLLASPSPTAFFDDRIAEEYSGRRV